MEPQSGNAGSGNHRFPPPASGNSDGKVQSEPQLEPLPPPMFPSGARQVQGRRRSPISLSATKEEDDRVPEDAFILPDEPIRRPDEEVVRPDETGSLDAPWEGGPTEFAEGAFIDPDAPIVRSGPPRKPADYEAVLRGAPWLDVEDVVVTGIGDDPHLDDEDTESLLSPAGDPHVTGLVRAVERLAEALRTRGEAGLRSAPDMTRFEATLRAYCAGYLAGARETGEGN